MFIHLWIIVIGIDCSWDKARLSIQCRNARDATPFRYQNCSPALFLKLSTCRVNH